MDTAAIPPFTELLERLPDMPHADVVAMAISHPAPALRRAAQAELLARRGNR